MKKFFKYSIYILFLPLWWLQLLLPRDPKIWVFGAWYGEKFSDNSRYLFSYIAKNQPTIKPIWITRSKEICYNNNSNNKIYMYNSFKGIYYTLLAKVVIVSSGKRDINYFFINGAKKVQLWHGQPMKKIGLDDKLSNSNFFFQKYIVRFFFPFAYEYNYDYVVSNAKIFSNKMASAFNVPLERILETGCPRNDIFFSKKIEEYNLYLKNKFKGAKIVYYLPTFRNHDKVVSIFGLEEYNKVEIEKFLEKENIVLVSKGHFVDNVLGEKDIDKENQRIVHLADKDVSDINALLKDADALITDYSGAYFDFLLTGKPLIFASFDLDIYLSSSREMYFNYKDVVAGPIVLNWKDLKRSLSDLYQKDEYELARKEKNNIFNKYHDGNNSKRVFDKIKNIV